MAVVEHRAEISLRWDVWKPVSADGRMDDYIFSGACSQCHCKVNVTCSLYISINSV